MIAPLRSMLRIVLATLPLLLAAGCSEPGAGPAPMDVSLLAWQRGVEQYVNDEGNGDPNILRDTTLPTSQRGFSLIGEPSIDRSTDANGLLLDHRAINGRNWFIFLVGLIDAGTIQDIRLVALCRTSDQFIWKVSEPDPAAIERYTAGDEHRRGTYASFPEHDDLFELTAKTDEIRVDHTRSGARWRLALPPAQNARD